MADDRNRYLVTYDIADDRARAKVSDALEKVGLRVQKSVFECSVAEDALDALAAYLGRLVDGQDDADIRVYRLCRDCFQDSFGLGDTERGVGSQPWIVV